MSAASPLRTVVAEGDDDQRRLMTLALDRDEHLEVVHAVDGGRAAVDAVVEHRADLLVLDPDLPDGDGFDTVAAVGERCPDCACVFVTSLPPAELAWARPVGVVDRATSVLRLGAEVRAAAAATDAAERARDAVLPLDDHQLAPRAARRFVDHVLADAGFGEVLDTVELLVTEVVTNALLHARTPATVVVRVLPDAVRVEVVDGDDSFPVRRRPHPDVPGGRGLELVERLSRSWGIDMLPVGKRTWFEVARSTDDG